MGPAAYRVRGGRAALQDQRGQAALDQVGGCGEPSVVTGMSALLDLRP